MAEDLDRLRRLPEVISMMKDHKMHFVESDPEFKSSSGESDLEASVSSFKDHYPKKLS